MKCIFSIVFSNYSAQCFAWPGSAKANRKYLGNRQVIGTVEAASADEALKNWNARTPAAAS